MPLTLYAYHKCLKLRTERIEEERRGYTVENTQHTLQRSPEKVTAGEVHPTQGDTNPKGIARKTSAHFVVVTVGVAVVEVHDPANASC